MFLEEKLNEKNFFHYLNLYHFNNLKQLHNSIITEVPFLEIEEDKMLSFNDSKEYTKGTLSNQLKEYINRKNLIDYVNDRNLKYNSNNFYDKFFNFNQETDEIELFEYNKSISSNAFLGLYPFRISPEEFITGNEVEQKKLVTFLITCEISPHGVVSLKAFNEKLLSELLGDNNNNYTLRFQYNIKDKSLIHILENLNLELATYLSKKQNNYENINKKILIKEIDKKLFLLENMKEKKKYYYQIDNKINFLFYENENIVNNNLYDYYKKEILEKFSVHKDKDKDNEEKDNKNLIKISNSLNNKNILNFYFKLLDNNFNTIEKTTIIKYKNRLITFDNLEELKKENFEDFISIVYLFNLILKRKKINKFYSVFIVGNDKNLKNFALNTENLNYKKQLKDYININTKTLFDEKKRISKLNSLIDYYNEEDIANIITFIDDDTQLFEKDFKTYNLEYITLLKEEAKKIKDNEHFIDNEKETFFEKSINFILGKKKPKKQTILEVNGEKFLIDKIEQCSIGASKISFIKENIEMKKNVYIDLNAFNEFNINELIQIYIKTVLNTESNKTINEIFNKNKNLIEFLLPVIYGKSNVLIDKIKEYGKIDTIIVDKPDFIPFYYLFPILYNCNYMYTLNNEVNRKTTGYWAGFSPKILNANSNNIKNKITTVLKYNNEYEKEKVLLEYIQEKINFKIFTTDNFLLCSIKEILNKIN